MLNLLARFFNRKRRIARSQPVSSNHSSRYLSYRDRGFQALAQHHTNHAIEAFGRAALLCPRLAEAHYNLGLALNAAGKIEAARQAYLRALSLDPDLSEVRSMLLALPPLPPERDDFQVDQVLHADGMEGSFLVMEVKRGGFATVYVVVSMHSKNFWALKTFQSRFLWNDEHRRRFEREALAWIQLDRHPNVATAQGLLRIEGFPCLWLEYLPANLAEALRERRLPPAAATKWGLQICDGMSYLHEKLGLVHRDLKPANCLLTEDLIIKVADFGLARAFAEAQERSLGLSDLSADVKAQFTLVGGTPPYMAPEQFEAGRSLDSRTDVFAFGIMFYEMLTQDLPPIGRARDHIKHWAPAYKISEDLTETILQCVQTDPRRRPKDFRELRRLLERPYRRLTGRSAPPPAGPLEMKVADWNDKGIALEALGYFEEACACYERAISLDNRNASIWMNYGAGLSKLGRFPAALACYEKGLEINPTNAMLWSNKAMSLESLGRLAEAKPCHERAVELEPQHETLWMNFGACLGDMGQLDEAIRCYERALEINPRSADLWCNRANNLCKTHRFEDALVSCDYGLAIQPLHHVLWCTRAHALMNLGRLEDALVACVRGLEIKPTDATLWRNKGSVLSALGRGEEANECLARAQSLRT